MKFFQWLGDSSCLGTTLLHGCHSFNQTSDPPLCSLSFQVRLCWGFCFRNREHASVTMEKSCSLSLLHRYLNRFVCFLTKLSHCFFAQGSAFFSFSTAASSKQCYQARNISSPRSIKFLFTMPGTRTPLSIRCRSNP